MSVIKLVQGDNRPFITVTLSKRDGDPVNLSDPTTSVRIYFRRYGTDTILSTIVCGKLTDGTDGKVIFNFPAPVLDVEPGNYEGEIEVDFDGEKQTVFTPLRFVIRGQFD